MRALLDFILPPRCRLCAASTTGESTPWVCQQCWLAIDYVVPPLCVQCGQPFAAPPEGIASPTHRCGACITEPPPYAQARAVGLYQGPLRDIIHAMKYQGVYGLVRPLAELLQAQFAWHWGGAAPEALLPIPLHRSKLRQREFDQALALLAQMAVSYQPQIIQAVLALPTPAARSRAALYSAGQRNGATDVDEREVNHD